MRGNIKLLSVPTTIIYDDCNFWTDPIQFIYTYRNMFCINFLLSPECIWLLGIILKMRILRRNINIMQTVVSCQCWIFKILKISKIDEKMNIKFMKLQCCTECEVIVFEIKNYFEYSSRQAFSPEWVARKTIIDTSLMHRLKTGITYYCSISMRENEVYEIVPQFKSSSMWKNYSHLSKQSTFETFFFCNNF